MKPTSNAGKIKYFAFAASVYDKSDPSHIYKIGRQIGDITLNNSEIRIIESPFLGCGDGGLDPHIAMPALASGFLDNSHEESVLSLCSDSSISARLAEISIRKLDRERERSILEKDSFEVSRINRHFDIAMSFSSTERDAAEQLSITLQAHGITYFLDSENTAELWGKDGVKELYDIYNNRAAYCVVFVSREYNRRMWTNHERSVALSRRLEEGSSDYVLPIAMDGSRLEGLPSSVFYIDWAKGPEYIAEALHDKLHRHY